MNKEEIQEKREFKEKLEEFKESANSLQIEVIEDLEDYETEEEAINYLKDILQHGCISGMVSKLIYYTDTNKFYDRNEEEIEDLIHENKENFGYKKRAEFIASLNGSAENMTQEKNLLSWFAYEETARFILNELFKVDY